MNVSDITAPRLSAPGKLAGFLKDYLLDDIMAFWLRHAIDSGGGINTCIRDDGSIVSRDKWLWSQWRAVWVFSTLHTLIEPRPEFLRIARDIFRFAARHGWDDKAGGWVLTLSGDGPVVRGYESIYADGFAIYGAVALARAGGDPEAIEVARRTAESVLRRLEMPHEQMPHFPYPVAKGARMHGIPMIFSLVFWELGEFLNDDRYRGVSLRLSEEIFGKFYRPSHDAILERMGADGAEMPPPLGTTVVPGHGIEDMWFQMHIAHDRGDKKRIAQAIRLIKRHVELGWDPKYGGLFLAVDADGRDEVGWDFADTKLWWPHTEALYALILAYEHSREPWCSEWFDRVWDYSFAHYPLKGPGEWRQKLSRTGEPITAVVALPVKDPFHLPRALIYCIKSLERIAGK